MVRWRLQGARNNLDSVLIWPYLGICTARAVVKVARVFKICWCLSFLHRLSVARLIARLFHRRSWTLTDYVIIDCWLNFCFNWVQLQVLVFLCLIHRLEIERCDFRLRKGIKAISKANVSPRLSRDVMLVYFHVEVCFTNTLIAVIRDVVNVFKQVTCSFLRMTLKSNSRREWRLQPDLTLTKLSCEFSALWLITFTESKSAIHNTCS